MNPNHDGTHSVVTLTITLPENADPRMVADLYEMLGLDIDGPAPGITIVTRLILHGMRPENVADAVGKFDELFPGCTYETAPE